MPIIRNNMKTQETTQGRITERNGLIAEFMGLKPNETAMIWGRYSISHNHHTCTEDTVEKALNGFASIAKFHASWDWLMPVVEKIESLIFPDDEYFNFHILGGCCVYIISSHGDEFICSDRGQSKIECVYSAVVEFIQWYNQQKATP